SEVFEKSKRRVKSSSIRPSSSDLKPRDIASNGDQYLPNIVYNTNNDNRVTIEYGNQPMFPRMRKKCKHTRKTVNDENTRIENQKMENVEKQMQNILNVKQMILDNMHVFEKTNSR